MQAALTLNFHIKVGAKKYHPADCEFETHDIDDQPTGTRSKLDKVRVVGFDFVLGDSVLICLGKRLTPDKSENPKFATN